MPWAPLQPIGIGAGAAAGNDINQQRGMQQQDFLANLLIHLQQTQQQRDQLNAYRQESIADRQQRTKQAADAAAQSERIRQDNLTRENANAVPSLTQITPSDYQQYKAAGAGNLFQPTPIQAPAPPPALAANGGGSSGESQAQDLAGTVSNSPMPSATMFQRIPTDAYLAKQAADKLAQQRQIDTQNNQADRSGAMWQRLSDLESKAGQPSATGWDLQKATDGKGNDVWVRINKATGEIRPVNQSEFSPPTNATTSNRVQSAKAVVQTGQDIINEIKKNAAILGPAMSRYDSAADFFGAPPKEFSKLAGMIESYSLANMGVHGMRSNGGAEDIKRTIGLNRHTPDSLIETINGLNGFANHLLQNNKTGADGGTGTQPSDDIRVGGTYNGKKILKIEPVQQ